MPPPIIGSQSVRMLLNDNIVSSFSFTSQANENYLVMYVSNRYTFLESQMPRLIIDNNYALKYYPKVMIDGDTIEPNNSLMEKKYCLFGNFDGIYRSYENEDVSVGNVFDLEGEYVY